MLLINFMNILKNPIFLIHFNTSNVINQLLTQTIMKSILNYFNTSNVINQRFLEKKRKMIIPYFNTSNVINQRHSSMTSKHWFSISIHQMLLINKQKEPIGFGLSGISIHQMLLINGYIRKLEVTYNLFQYIKCY